MSKATKPGQGRSVFDTLAQVRGFITERDITVDEFAKKCGISDRTLRAMLAPGYSNKTLSAVDSLAKALATFKKSPPPKRKRAA